MIKLVNADCMKVLPKLPDRCIDLVLCDLPYGTTQNKWDSIIPLDALWAEYRRICKGCVVLTAQCPFDKVLGCSNLRDLKYEWIWQKEMGTGHLNAKKAPLKNHENVLVFASGPHKYFPQMRTGFKPYTAKAGAGSSNYGKQVGAVTESNGERYPLTVTEFPRDRDKLHPTQKPVALMEYLIKTYTNPGDVVLDNCMGSGTTGVAAKNLNRRFIGIEMNKEYFEIAKKRIDETPAPVVEQQQDAA